MNKGKAFVICISAIMFIFISLTVTVIVKKDELSLIPVGPCLAGIGTLIAAYIAGNVADHGVMGKTWNQEMYNSLNNSKGAEDDGEKQKDAGRAGRTGKGNIQRIS